MSNKTQIQLNTILLPFHQNKNISFKSYIVIKGKTYQFISKVLILNLNTIISFERIRNKILISIQKVFQLELINLKLSYLAYDMNLSDTIGNESMN